VNGELKHVPKCANYTYPSEEAEWYADHPVIPYMPTKREMFEVIQGQFNVELQQCKDWLDGKIKMREELFYKWSDRKLCYLEDPELFEEDVADLEHYWGELSDLDKEWIKNTRKLLKGYGTIVKEQLERVFQNTVK